MMKNDHTLHRRLRLVENNSNRSINYCLKQDKQYHRSKIKNTKSRNQTNKRKRNKTSNLFSIFCVTQLVRIKLKQTNQTKQNQKWSMSFCRGGLFFFRSSSFFLLILFIIFSFIYYYGRTDRMMIGLDKICHN